MDILNYFLPHLTSLKNPTESAPKYWILTELIKDTIEKNPLLENAIMPSSRVLASELKVSRSTVVKAYELLLIEGYLESKKGSGYTILERSNGKREKEKSLENDLLYPKLSKMGKSFQQNIHIMNSEPEEYITFRPGLPPLDIFSIDQWKKLSNLHWRTIKTSSLNYSNVSGLTNLKKNIANYLYLMRGIKCDYEQVIIVSGSVQSLFLVASTLLERRDAALMENPTFPNVQAIFKSLTKNVWGVEMDSEGMNIQSVDKEIKPKLIHVTPSNHYPTGVIMSLKRRQELLAYAKENQSIIIENDYDHEISNWGIKNPSLYELDQDNRVVYLGTFNRLLHPSFRMAYMVVPYYLLEVIEAFQMHSHRFVSPSNQVVLSEFINKNLLFNHIKSVVEVAEDRLQLFKEIIEQHADPSLKVEHSDARSLHALLSISEDFDDQSVSKKLYEHQIVSHRYSKCFVENHKQGLIFGYSAARKHLMQKKLMELIDVYNQILTKI